MNQTPSKPYAARTNRLGWWLLLAAFALTIAVYWPGLSGGFLFDDYPNIVDNHGVQPQNASFSSLVGAALSSPSSEFKRPLASLSFAANYLISGLNPYWMKLTNVVIHLLNGLLIFLLTRALLRSSPIPPGSSSSAGGGPTAVRSRIGIIAALVAAGWMLLPINLTGVLYVVQRMESMANLFVLLGLIGYVAGRRRMLAPASASVALGNLPPKRISPVSRGFLLCLVSITISTATGVLAKETAVMLPLYALLIEWILFGFQRSGSTEIAPESEAPGDRRPDRRIIGLFLLVLVLPIVVGLTWLLPGILNPETWASRDFSLATRLLSEARIVVDYIVWTLLPTPHALSFYHDNFRISSGLLAPWTTLASMLVLASLIALVIGLRKRQPLVALGIALFLGCQLLTGTILPLELIYEHRNYFASFGLLLAIIPPLAAPSRSTSETVAAASSSPKSVEAIKAAVIRTPTAAGPTNAAGAIAALPMAIPRYVLLAGLLLCWTILTALTAYAWGNPLRLAEDLASRAPLSPRAEYELGRTYIIYSHYDPASPFTKLAYAPLEKAAALPESSILPEQALIFMNSRMHLPVKEIWWNSMIAKLRSHKPGVQDESSLGALTQCMRENHCDLPRDPMTAAFLAALAHPDPSARLLAMYSDYAWNVLGDHKLGARMIKAAIKVDPNEPAYRITEIRMLVAQDQLVDATVALKRLATLNIGGSLTTSLLELRNRISGMPRPVGSSSAQ